MEDKNELSDIVLEKDDNKALKTKRILVITALLILVFLLVLVVMKLINKPDSNEEQSKLLLPPEPALTQETTKKDDQLFKQVPIIQEDEADKKESFEEMVKNLKEKEIQKGKVPSSSSTTTQPKKEEVKAPEKPKSPQIKEVKKPKATTPTKKEVSKEPSSTTAKNGIYIQVGATSKYTPSKKFLATIKSKNYTYRLLPITINGKKVTKILVGPFANTSSAKKSLEDVKKQINKDAFIYRVK
jgi:DedD protein